MLEALNIRTARPADGAALREMQALSFRALGASFYSPAVIERYLTEVGTLDDHLLQDGHYRVATLDGDIVGCGGWSRRPAAYSSCASKSLQHGSSGATVRAVYVHPRWARCGIAGRIMAEVESGIAAAGFRSAELHSTLSGVSFYRRLRYTSGDSVALCLSGGLALEVVEMRKALLFDQVEVAA